MDLYDDEDVIPSLAVGRLSLLTYLAYLPLAYFLLRNNGVTEGPLYLIFLFAGIYVLLALRQKFIFFDDHVHIKRIARQPVKIKYKEISSVTLVESKKNPHVFIQFGGEKHFKFPLLMESKLRKDQLEKLFKDKDVEVNRSFG